MEPLAAKIGAERGNALPRLDFSDKVVIEELTEIVGELQSPPPADPIARLHDLLRNFQECLAFAQDPRAGISYWKQVGLTIAKVPRSVAGVTRALDALDSDRSAALSEIRQVSKMWTGA